MVFQFSSKKNITVASVAQDRQSAIWCYILSCFILWRKPSDTAILDESIDELRRLISDGLDVNGLLLAVEVSSLICDAPARAMVKCVKPFSAYYGWDRYAV